MSIKTKRISLKDLKMLDLLMSGEAARICGVDRRTFWRRVNQGEIKPIAEIEGKLVFRREDVEALAKKIRAEKASK